MKSTGDGYRCLLPKKIIEDIRGVKQHVKSELYLEACYLIFDLDEEELLSDHLNFVYSESGISLEWSNLDLYLDINTSLVNGSDKIVFCIDHVPTRTIHKISNYKIAKLLLVGLLGDVNIGDRIYRKDQRTTENSIECVKGTMI